MKNISKNKFETETYHDVCKFMNWFFIKKNLGNVRTSAMEISAARPGSNKRKSVISYRNWERQSHYYYIDITVKELYEISAIVYTKLSAVFSETLGPSAHFGTKKYRGIKKKHTSVFWKKW